MNHEAMSVMSRCGVVDEFSAFPVLGTGASSERRDLSPLAVPVQVRPLDAGKVS